MWRVFGRFLEEIEDTYQKTFQNYLTFNNIVYNKI